MFGGAALLLATVLLAACGSAGPTQSAPSGPASSAAPTTSSASTTSTRPAPTGSTAAPAKTTALTPVTFQLDWIPFGRHAPYYVALDKGYYKDAGLNVKIVQGTGTTPGYAQLAAGRAQFAFNDISYIPIFESKTHVNVEALAAIYAKAPQTIFFLKGHGISRPSDLNGKTIAYSEGDSGHQFFPLFAKLNGINAASIKWQQITPQALVPTLLGGKVDAMSTYILTKPTLQTKAPKGVTIGGFMYGDYHVPDLNNGLLVRRSWALQHADLVRGFVQATMKGVAFALANPSAAIAIERKYEPKVDPQQGVAELQIIKNDLIDTPAAKAHCLGWIDPTQMQDTVKVVQQAYQLAGPFNVSQMYTNQFLACAQ